MAFEDVSLTRLSCASTFTFSYYSPSNDLRAMLLKFLILGGFAWLVDVIITLIINPLNCGRLSAVNLYSLNAFL